MPLDIDLTLALGDDVRTVSYTHLDVYKRQSLNVPQLRGTLRGRPLDARGDFTLRGQQGQGDLALSLGGSRVTARGSVGNNLDVQAAFQPLLLNDLLPGGAGSLAGTLKPVSYTHLDVYKRQGLNDPDSSFQIYLNIGADL